MAINIKKPINFKAPAQSATAGSDKVIADGDKENVVPLIDGYRVRIERMNFVLEELSPGGNPIKKNGVVIGVSGTSWLARGYYSNFKNLIEAITEAGIKKYSDDLTKIHAHFDEVQRMIQGLPDLIIALGERTIVRYVKGEPPRKDPADKKKKKKKEEGVGESVPDPETADGN